jgi:hypothetical protein
VSWRIREVGRSAVRLDPTWEKTVGSLDPGLFFLIAVGSAYTGGREYDAASG